MQGTSAAPDACGLGMPTDEGNITEKAEKVLLFRLSENTGMGEVQGY